MQTESARLEELRRLALEERIEADLALGRGPELVPELEALVAQRPLDEHPRAQLMLALYRAGRQADALTVFREGRRVLDEELGLELGAQLRELERAILRQDPTLSVTAAAKPSSSIIAVSERPTGLALLLPLAEALARGPTARELVLAQIVHPAEIADATRTLEQARHDLRGRGVAVRVAAFSSSSPAEDVVRLTTVQDADLLLVASAGDPLSGTLAGVFAEATCDVAALIEWPWDAEGGPIVVPFGAFEHDWAALELGAWAATVLGSTVAPHRCRGRTSRRARCQPSACGCVADRPTHDRSRRGAPARPSRKGRRRRARPGCGAPRSGAVGAMAHGGTRSDSVCARSRSSGADRARTTRAAAERDRASGGADALHLVDRTVDNRTLRCHLSPERSWPVIGSRVSSVAAAWGSSTGRPSSRSTGLSR